MTKTLAASCAVMFARSTGAGAAWAQATDQTFQLALFNPVQIHPEDDVIRVLRLSLLYGKNVSVKGLDVGLVSHTTGGISKGLQYGLVGYNEADFLGWQHNFAVNITAGVFTGFQSGAYNQAGSGEVVQIGFVNVARDVSGFQLGLVNVTDDLYGLQIGLVNIIRNKEGLPFFPIFNWRF